MKKALPLLICLLHAAFSSLAQLPGPDVIRPFGEQYRQNGSSGIDAGPYSNALSPASEVYGNPPEWAWVEKFGGDGLDFVSAFVQDASGDYYFTGAFSGAITVAGSSFTSQGVQDMFVAKASNNGSVLWMKQFPAGEGESLAGTSIDEDGNGNLYVTGYFSGSTSAFGSTLSTNKPRIAFLARLDDAGNPQWGVSYDQNFNERIGRKIRVVGPNELLLMSKGTRNWSTLAWFNTDGQLISEDLSLEVFADFDVYGDNLYFTGSIIYPTTFGNTTLDPDAAYESVFIIKTSLSGEYEWVQMVPGTENGFNFASSMAVDENGCYISGRNRGPSAFGPDTAPDGQSFFISRLDSDGNFIWASFFEDMAGTSPPLLALDGQSDVVAVGGLAFSLGLPDGTTIESNKESYWLKLDGANGDYLQAEAIDGASNAIGSAADGAIIKAGHLFGDLDLRKIDASGPAVEWSMQSEGQSGRVRGFQESRLAVNESGHAYFTGLFRYDFPAGDTVLFSYNTAGAILKVDDSGQVLWAKSLEADKGTVSIRATALAEDGAFLVGGSFFGTINTPLGAFTGDNPSFIARYASDGTLLSFLTMSSSELWAIEVDTNGDVLVGGTYRNELSIGGQSIQSQGAADAFLAKLTPGLGLVWIKNIGGERDEYAGIVSADEAGNIYCTLEARSVNFTAGEVSLTLQEGDGNIVLVKFGPDGGALWARAYGGGDPAEFLDNYCWPVAMEVDGAGKVYMAGMVGADNDFGGVQLVNSSWQGSITHGYNWFVATLDADGNGLWADNINHRSWIFSAFQLGYDEEGNLYMGGEFRDSVFLLDGAMVLTPDEGAQSNGLLAKYDSNGNLEWLQTMGGDGNRVNAVAVTGEDKLAFGGSFFGDLLVDDQTGLYNSADNLFLASTGGLSTDVRYLSPEHFALAAAPNPFRTALQISLKLEEAQTVHFALYDTRGRMVQAFAPVDLPGSGEHAVSLAPSASLPRGMYFLQVRAGDVVTVKKVEKM